MVSQPAVSKQLKTLERAAGARLFDRHPKGVRLTGAGEVLADYARRIFGLADEAETALADLQSLRRGQLNIGAGTTIGVYFLPELLVRYRQRFPGIQLGLEIEGSAILQRQLLDGTIEFGLTEVPIRRPEVEATVFMHDELV